MTRGRVVWELNETQHRGAKDADFAWPMMRQLFILYMAYAQKSWHPSDMEVKSQSVRERQDGPSTYDGSTVMDQRAMPYQNLSRYMYFFQ